MALIKEIELDNGIITNYHRIVSFNNIINKNNIIEVASYTSKNQRIKEKEYQNVQEKNINSKELSKDEKELLIKGINVFINTNFINKEYVDGENIEDAYEYLKTLDIFSGAIDD